MTRFASMDSNPYPPSCLRSVRYRTAVLVLLAGAAGCGAVDDVPRTARRASALSTIAHVTDPATRASGGTPPAPARHAEDRVAAFAAARVRVVWIQDAQRGADFFALSASLTLHGYDSHDGLGERTILSTVANYAKPLITPDGEQVVFSDRVTGSVHAVGWDGAGLRRLVSGFGLATWSDPSDGTIWVYVGEDEAATDPPSYRRVTRYRLDEPDTGELVWNKAPVSGDTFQISRDGRHASGLFPWPTAGIAELPNGAWEKLGDGCWTSLADWNGPLCWYFDGAHRNVTIVDVDRSTRWQVAINTAPDIDDYEVYHPRWSNHPRFLVLSGPYTVGNRANKIRGGGTQVEIHLGRFAPDLTAVEAWVPVTDNVFADFYPDAWIDPDGEPAHDVTGRAGTGGPAGADTPQSTPADGANPAAGRLLIEARLVATTPIPTLRAIAPYRSALIANTYQVETVVEGVYAEPTIVVAHWAIRDAQVVPGADREIGRTYRMTVDPYDDHLELEGERLLMDTDNFDVPLYYDTTP